MRQTEYEGAEELSQCRRAESAAAAAAAAAESLIR